MDGRNGDGHGNDLPWASVFDPAANARALSAVQAEGFRAASALVDRFVRAAAGRTNSNGSTTASRAPLTADERADLFGATDIEPLIRSWWATIGQLLLGSPRPNSAAAEGVIFDFATGEANGLLNLESVAPGVASVEVWLHNRGIQDRGDIRLRCSDFLAHDGALIPSSAVRYDQDSVNMPGRSSRGIELKVVIAESISPGVYRGVLLVDGHPDLWLPMVLTIRPTVS